MNIETTEIDEIPGSDQHSLAQLGFPFNIITSNGSVWSLLSNDWMSTSLDRRGYERVNLFNRITKKHMTIRIHRLVAKMFIPNPENKPQVNHIDGNKQNNTVSNLEWCTNLENAKHSRENGLMPHNKLTEENVHLICKRLTQGIGVGEICRLYGFPYTAVWAISARRNWTHISDNYILPAIKKMAFIPRSEIVNVCRMLSEHKSSEFIAKIYGVSRACIDKIRIRKNHTDISVDFKW
jgi:hypothetical protein